MTTAVDSTTPELVAALKETLEACKAAMRVIAAIDLGTQMESLVPGIGPVTREQAFLEEAHRAGVKDGFGVRAKAALDKAEGRS